MLWFSRPSPEVICRLFLCVPKVTGSQWNTNSPGTSIKQCRYELVQFDIFITLVGQYYVPPHCAEAQVDWVPVTHSSLSLFLVIVAPLGHSVSQASKCSQTLASRSVSGEHKLAYKTNEWISHWNALWPMPWQRTPWSYWLRSSLRDA